MQIAYFPFTGPEQADFRYAVIVARYRHQWIFVKHRERTTLEIPGGRREPGESILATASRELIEETGASRFQLIPIEAYSVSGDQGTTYGLLCFAWIQELGAIPSGSEIEKVTFQDLCPKARDLLTYPEIQPALFARVHDKTALLAHLARYKHLIWDWNGTLLDDVSISTDVIGEILRDHGLPEIHPQRYREIFGFPVIEYYRKLGFDFSKTPFEIVGDQFIARYNSRIHESKLFRGVPEILKLIKQMGIQQSILSAASQWHLDEITATHGVREHFEHICGIDNHYASSKVARGQELIHLARINPKETLLIGDTDHDLQVAKSLGTDALLIADGHQSFERLKALHHNVLPSRYPSSE